MERVDAGEKNDVSAMQRNKSYSQSYNVCIGVLYGNTERILHKHQTMTVLAMYRKTSNTSRVSSQQFIVYGIRGRSIHSRLTVLIK